MDITTPFIQQLGIAGVVVAILLAGLRWMATMFKEAMSRAAAMHERCEERQSAMVQHIEEFQNHQLDRNQHAMHAMARALDAVASAINDTRTPVRPMRVQTNHDIVPP